MAIAIFIFCCFFFLGQILAECIIFMQDIKISIYYYYYYYAILFIISVDIHNNYNVHIYIF